MLSQAILTQNLSKLNIHPLWSALAVIALFVLTYWILHKIHFFLAGRTPYFYNLFFFGFVLFFSVHTRHFIFTLQHSKRKKRGISESIREWKSSKVRCICVYLTGNILFLFLCLSISCFCLKALLSTDLWLNHFNLPSPCSLMAVFTVSIFNTRRNLMFYMLEFWRQLF